MDDVICRNILINLKTKKKTKEELSNYLCISEEELNKKLLGAKIINAKELNKIAKFFDIEINDLFINNNPIANIKSKIKTKQGQESIEIVDKILDMIIYYRNERINFEEMNKPYND